MPIDLFKDGVQATYNHIMEKAYGGVFPSGGYDFPASAIVSRTPNHDSHFHVEIDQSDVQGSFEISEDSDLAFMNVKPEEGSATTDSPFNWPKSLARFPGVFGSALKSYCELRAILLAYQTDVNGLDNWFRDLWDLRDAFDLNYCTPRLRSTGYAIWGGVSRVLRPMMTMLPATAPGLVVKHHGLHRTMLGENKLVDWSRISAIAKGIAAQLLADDMVAKGNVTRMDFYVAVNELPVAPEPEDVILYFDYQRKTEGSDRFSKAMEAAIFKAKGLECKISNRYANVSVEAPEHIHLQTEEVLKLMGHGTATSKYDELAMWEPVDEEFYDINMPRRPLPTVHDSSMNMMNTINTVIMGRLKHSGSQFPRGDYIKGVISSMDANGATAKGFRELRVQVQELYADKFLVLLKHLGDINHPGRGVVWVNRFLKSCGFKRSVGPKDSLVELFRQASHSIAGVKRLAEIAARVVNDVDNWKASNFVMELSDRALSTGVPSRLAADMIRKKQIYWMNRCRRNFMGRRADSSSRAHMIVSQFRAKVLRMAKFIIKQDGTVVVDETTIIKAFAESIDKFRGNKRKYGEYPKVISTRILSMEEIVDECQQVDKEYDLPKELKMSVMLNHVRDYMSEFIRDISGTFEKVFSFNTDTESMDGDDLSTDNITDVEEEPAESLIHGGEVKEKPVVARDYGGMYGRTPQSPWKLSTGNESVGVEVSDYLVEEGAHSAKNLQSYPEIPVEVDIPVIGDDECIFDDSDVEGDVCAPPMQASLDLIKELEEDFPGIVYSEYHKYIVQYGVHISYPDYKVVCEEIREKARQAMVKNFAAGKHIGSSLEDIL